MIFQKGAIFNRSNQHMPHFYATLHEVFFLTNRVTSLVYPEFGKLYFCKTEIEFI